VLTLERADLDRRVITSLFTCGLVLPAVAFGEGPPGATARCNDGTYSFSQHHSGTCSHHRGVAVWLDGSAVSGAGSPGRGTSRNASSLLLSNGQAQYDHRTAVSRSVISNGSSSGLLSAARATYYDNDAVGVGALGPRATVSVYVYRTAAAATSGLEAVCPATSCSKSSAAASVGIRIRFRTRSLAPKRCIEISGVRSNSVVDVYTCAVKLTDGSPYTVAKLEDDGSFLIGRILSQA
jgi:hypothetical protein